MIRATIVLLATHLLVPRLRRLSAAQRHLLYAASLAVAAIVPLFAVALPAWRPDWTDRVAGAWPAPLTLPWGIAGSPDVILRPMGIESSSWTIAEGVVVLWVCGSLVAMMLLAAEFAKLRRLLWAARPLTDRRCLGILADAADAIGLDRPPLLLHSPRAIVPMTWGARRPRVLLPGGAPAWPDERLRAVLMHELAHVRRHDWLVHVAAQCACAAYWFHPLFWALDRRLCRESEQAADDEVLEQGVEGSAYAGHLLEVVRASRGFGPRGSVVAMSRATHLEERVSALLDAAANRRPITAPVAAAALALLLVSAPLVAITNQGSLPLVIVRAVEPTLTLPSSRVRDGAPPGLPAVRYVSGPQRPLGAAETVVAPAIAEYTTPPLYSDEARRRRIEGLVTIAGRVGVDGRLTGARVVSGLGFGLDQNALVAARQWRFTAGTARGMPAAMDAEIDVEFSLETQAINELIANDMATVVGPGVTPPRAIRTPGRADVPAGARGSVVLDVLLLEDGSPTVLRILQSLSPEADERAVRHFEQWRFSPAMKAGVPVKVRMTAEVRFHG